MLIQYLAPLLKKERQIGFFDEFPWINSPRSGFLPAFENFWNSWVSKEKKLIVVICGSAASWMIKKVINNPGGLHNRVTRRIRLLPFTIAETAGYLKARNIKLDQYQILQIYMALGGIPQYLKEIQPGESAAQIIDRLCFTKDDLLKRALGISSVYSDVSVWRYQPKPKLDQGLQIDMLIDRNDRCINICEMKFTGSSFEITKSYAKELASTLKIFQEQTRTRKALFMTLITTYGVKNEIDYPGLIQQQITMDILFKA